MHHYNYITIDHHDSAQLNIALYQALAIALEHYPDPGQHKFRNLKLIVVMRFMNNGLMFYHN